MPRTFWDSSRSIENEGAAGRRRSSSYRLSESALLSIERGIGSK